MKLVVDSETDKVLGASMCGPDAPEIIQVSKVCVFISHTKKSWHFPVFTSILHLTFHQLQGMAVALKCGTTKATFDSTVRGHNNKPVVNIIWHSSF